MEPNLFVYPVQWIDRWQLANGKSVTVRPVLPQDDALERDFVASQLTDGSRYQRFMVGMRELPLSVAQYFTRIDYHDHFALIAETFDGQAHRQVGDARFVRVDGAPDSAEFALAVADTWQGLGLGRRLLQALLSAAQAHGVHHLYGNVLRDNQAMLELARASGFVAEAHPDDARLQRVARLLTAPVELIAPHTPHPANDGAWDRPRHQSPAYGS